MRLPNRYLICRNDWTDEGSYSYKERKAAKAVSNNKDKLIAEDTAQDEPSEDYTYSYDYDDDLTWDDDFWFVSFLRLLHSFDMYYHALTKSISYL